MKILALILTLTAGVVLFQNSAIAGCGVCDVKKKSKTAYQEVKGAKQVKAEVGCAKCIYSKKGEKGCRTAVKIDDKVYMLKAAAKEGECNAHKEGLCKTKKKATLNGKVVDDKFLATKVEIQKKTNG